MSDSQAPTVPYWHLWTDENGVSHQNLCAFSQFHMASMGGGADPQWQGIKITGAMTTMVTVQPVGWEGDWHENPKPQWIIPLSGRWSVESMDGTLIELGVGELSFGGDQHCKDHEGRKGHRSATVGDEPAVLMVIQFNDLPSPESPCTFQ